MKKRSGGLFALKLSQVIGSGNNGKRRIVALTGDRGIFRWQCEIIVFAGGNQRRALRKSVKAGEIQ